MKPQTTKEIITNHNRSRSKKSGKKGENNKTRRKRKRGKKSMIGEVEELNSEGKTREEV